MGTDSSMDRYEQAMKLAETGRHAEALPLVQEHLRENPRDVQGWNDAGAILYCLRRTEEAIEAFEKAKSLGGSQVSAEVYWNLVEAYLDGGYPGMAVRLFDEMERIGILAADTLNRTADAFLRGENLGGALEMLLRSLEMAGEQEILEPMIEVIRSKRARVALVAARDDARTRAVRRFLEQRFPLQVYIGAQPEELSAILGRSDITWLEGWSELVAETARQTKTCRILVDLRPGEVEEPGLETVDWEAIDAVLLGGGETDRRRLMDRVEGIERRTRLAAIREGVDVRSLACRQRRRGKNIAAVGPWDARSNPMLLLQCMQKLHYIDGTCRLHLAGSFTDAAVERYVRHMVDRLDLSGAVVFDNEVTDWNTWLADKHYIVSTAVDASMMPGVLTAMACGVKPVVHAFPDAEEWIESTYTFGIAEEFCRAVLDEAYEPSRYRAFVEQRYPLRATYRAMNDVLYRLEKDPIRAPQESRTEHGFTPLTDDWTPVEQSSSDVSATSPVPRVSGSSEAGRAIPITPISSDGGPVPIAGGGSGPRDMACVGPPAPDGVQAAAPSPYAQMGRDRVVERMAQQALEATRALEAMARNGVEGQTTGVAPAPIGPTDMSVGPYDSLESLRRDQPMQQAAREFSGTSQAQVGPPVVEDIAEAGEAQVPFVR